MIPLTNLSWLAGHRVFVLSQQRTSTLGGSSAIVKGTPGLQVHAKHRLLKELTVKLLPFLSAWVNPADILRACTISRTLSIATLFPQ